MGWDKKRSEIIVLEITLPMAKLLNKSLGYGQNKPKLKNIFL